MNVEQNPTAQKSKLPLIIALVLGLALLVGICWFIWGRGGDDTGNVAGGNSATATQSDTHEDLMKSSIKVVESVNVLLAGITDKASAEKAKDQLSQYNEQLQSLTARSEKIGKPSDQQQAELENLPGYQAAMEKLKSEFLRLTDNAEALEVVMQALPALDK